MKGKLIRQLPSDNKPGEDLNLLWDKTKQLIDKTKQLINKTIKKHFRHAMIYLITTTIFVLFIINPFFHVDGDFTAKFLFYAVVGYGYIMGLMNLYFWYKNKQIKKRTFQDE